MKLSLPVLSTLLAGIVCAVGASRVSLAEDAPAGQASAYVKPNITHEPYGEVRIVIPVTTDDKKVQGLKLRNVSNALKAAAAWHGSFTVRFVLYAKGLTLLEDPDEATKTQLDKLRSQGARFEVCNNSLAEQGIDFHTLNGVVDADIVPSGFAEVAYLQAKKHYVVDPSN